MTAHDLRTVATTLFKAAVVAADPALAVRTALRRAPLPPLSGGRYVLIAAGKAACAMMQEALAHLPDGAAYRAIAVTNYENARAIAGCDVLAAGHPVPDENGLNASKRVAGLLAGAQRHDFVLCLISGGGSALLPAPAEGISLADKIAVNEILLAHGFDITEINLIRQQLSRLKGGGMLCLAHPAQVRALIVSDVIGDDMRVIASGPTAQPIGTRAEAAALLKARGVWALCPRSVQARLSQVAPAGRPAPAQADNALIGSNRQSLQAVADAVADWTPHIVSDRLQGDVAEAADNIVKAIGKTPAKGRQLLIWGGETTVRLTGTGRGGRNQELALRVAQQADAIAGDWVFLSGGTDGRDGPTDAAGGLVDAGTFGRIRAGGLDPVAMLGNNDSYAALKAAGDLLITGATGTNVADVQIFLRT